MSAGGDSPRFQFSARWIPEKPDSGEQYLSGAVFVHPRLALGVNYRPLVDEFAFTTTVLALTETRTRPGIVLGTDVDEFDDVASRHYFGMVAKNVGRWQEVNVAPYVGAAYVEEIDELRGIGGLNLRYERWSTLLQYSGVNTHLTLSYLLPGNQTVSLIAFDLDLLGLAWFVRI